MTTTDQATALPAGPRGIGGWMILPILGLAATVVTQLINLSTLGDSLGIAGQLDGPRQALIIAEIVGNALIFLILPIVLLVLVTQKKRNFPRLYVVYSVVGAVFFVLDLILGYALFAEVYNSGSAEFFDSNTLRGIGGALAGLLIWTPYMLNSVRVKNTFVN